MKEDFLKYQAQTSPYPLAVEIDSANGCFVYDIKGKSYLDFIAGVSANTLGHNHPKISQAIKDQVDKYTHVMVYGEFIQKPQVELCKLLAENLPKNLDFLLFNTSFALPVLLHLSNIVYIIASRKDDLPDAFAANNPITSDNLEKSTLFFSPYENILSNSNNIGCQVMCLTDSTAGSFELTVRLICLIASISSAVASGNVAVI